MANRLSPKLLQRLRHFATTRPLNSAASSSVTSAHPSPPLHLTDNSAAAAIGGATLNLDDVKQLYATVPTGKLLRSAVTLHAAAMEPLVDLGTWVTRSGLMEIEVFRKIFLGVVRNTFFKQFCAGEDHQEACRTAAKICNSGLRAMLNYGSEHAVDNESCDRNLEGFIRTVEEARSLPESAVSFIVVKVTAICPLGLLQRVSDLLRWEYREKSCHLPWKLNTLPVFSDSSPLCHVQKKPDPLTPEEEKDLHLAHQRLQKISQKCIEASLPLVIDAEESWIQPGIDYFTYSAAIAHNKDNNPIIYGTIQAYLKDAKERLFRVMDAAEKIGVPMGIKLVRGACLSKERQVAASLGVESPVHNTIDQTHNCFNDCASFLLEKVADGLGAAVLATHNVESGRKAAALARGLGIGSENQKLQFAQLYGMADALSFALRNGGFQVSKYMPFGPVDLVIPYLLRRAEENKGFLPTSVLDKQLMRKELKRRLQDAILT
ncbi:proline dehydrogenase [Bertholletia excelsa]